MIPHHFRLEGVQYATGEKQTAITNSSRKNEEAGPKQKQCPAVDVSGGESKANSIKKNIAQEFGMLGP